MTKVIELVDVFALIGDLPQIGLVRGQVGTVVGILAPEVEVSDIQGKIYAGVSLRMDAARRADCWWWAGANGGTLCARYIWANAESFSGDMKR